MKLLRLLIVLFCTIILYSNTAIVVFAGDEQEFIGYGIEYKNKTSGDNEVSKYKLSIDETGYVDIVFGRCEDLPDYEYDFISFYNINWNVKIINNSNNEEIYSYEQSVVEYMKSIKGFNIKKGDYTLIIDGKYTSKYMYSLSVNYSECKNREIESNNTIDTSNDLIIGKPIHGVCYKEYDYFKFELIEDSLVSISFKRDIKDINCGWVCAVYNINNELVHASDLIGRDTLFTEFEFYLPKGIYYIKVASSGYPTEKDYVLTVNSRKCISYEVEGNDIITEATTLSINNSISGTLDNKDDVDWYSFTIDNDGFIEFDFIRDNLDLNTDKHYWLISIYREPEENVNYRVYYNYFDANADSDTSHKLGLKAGTYYIRVYSYHSGSTINYTNSVYEINLRFTEDDSWEHECNSSNVIYSDKTFHGTFYNTKDNDNYSFRLKTCMVATISYNRTFAKNENKGTSISMDLRLYDGSTFNTVYLFPIDGARESYESRKLILPAGDYYIGLDATEVSYKDVYSLTLHLEDCDNSENEWNDYSYSANELPFNKELNGYIEMSNFRENKLYGYQLVNPDWFTFTLNKSTNLIFNLELLNNSNIDIDICKEGSLDTPLFTKHLRRLSTSNESQYKINEIMTLEPGKYFIKLYSDYEYNDSKFIADYKISISTDNSNNFILGDVTEDGKVDIIDVITINKAILGKESLTSTQILAADINKNGMPDSTDSLSLLKAVVGLLTL